MRLSIVIPCYNERGTIREILARIERVVFPVGWEKEVVIVDDCSTDGTREILKEYETRHRVMYRAKNGGKGSALRDGLALATGTHVLIQDADLEYDPADIPALLTAVKDDRDAVFGSRELEKETRRGGRIARAGVLFMTWLFNFLHRTQLTDIWTCYKLFPRAAGADFTAGRFESEILFIGSLVRGGYHLKEVPISYSPRTFAEGKKIRYSDGVIGIYAILRDWLVHLPHKIMPRTF